MIEVTNSSPPAMMSITGSLSAPECAKKRPSVALCPNAEPPAVNTINAIPRPAVRPSPDRIFSSLLSRNHVLPGVASRRVVDGIFRSRVTGWNLVGRP